jgi:hypothetical protein
MKVRCIPSPERRLLPNAIKHTPQHPPRHRGVWELREFLKDLGVEVSGDEPEPDLLWVFGAAGAGGRAINVPSAVLECGVPLILDQNERDGHDLDWGSRRLLTHPSVVGLVKPTVLAPRGLYNRPMYGDPQCHWWHTTRVWEGAQGGLSGPAPVAGEPQLSDADLAKLEAGWSYNFYLCYWFRDMGLMGTVDLDAPRGMDAGFLGSTGPNRDDTRTIKEPWDALIWHRGEAVKSLRALKEAGDLAVDVHVTEVGKKETYVPYPDYVKRLLDTKVCVSPWGAGDRCIRDYEAMFLGCVLVKPETDFIETWPDIHRPGETYVPCKPDFSDLHEVVRGVVERWDEHRAMRQRALDLMWHASEETVGAEHMAGLLRRCLARAEG